MSSENKRKLKKIPVYEVMVGTGIGTMRVLALDIPTHMPIAEPIGYIISDYVEDEKKSDAQIKFKAWDTIEQSLERPYVYLECPKCHRTARANEAMAHDEDCKDSGLY